MEQISQLSLNWADSIERHVSSDGCARPREGTSITT